ncbi:MAG: MEDS domain-containing protein, partial [Thermoleophilia bacterium]|nr:MEDS domain-containing protein [Thermoleophilia bacterium]
MCGQAEGDLTARAHACLVYEHRDRVREAGPRWLRAGLERGERALVVSARGRADLREDLDGLGDVEGLIREGALVLLPPSEAYGGRGAPSPAASLAAYAAVTQRALTDGFSGLRVLADAP